jgi:TusA-related sulfurtransferase
MRTICILLLAFSLPAAAKEPADADDQTGKKELSMMWCPSAVAGARTSIENTPNGVVVVVSARDPAAQDEIRRRARRQEEVTMQPERGMLEHTGLGTGSGRYGHCPGMLENTTLELVNTTDGVRMIVKASYMSDVELLQKTTRARAKALRKMPTLRR